MENIKSEKLEKTKKTRTTKKKSQKKFFEYKGKPLVRCGNVLYYGNMSDKYVVKIETKKTKKLNDLEIATSTSVEMIDTSLDNLDAQKIVKISNKSGLYESLDIASIWLERALAE